jgi:hypothetical protein
LTYAGRSFIGWKLADGTASGTGNANADGTWWCVGDSITPTTNITLEAQWGGLVAYLEYEDRLLEAHPPAAYEVTQLSFVVDGAGSVQEGVDSENKLAVPPMMFDPDVARMLPGDIGTNHTLNFPHIKNAFLTLAGTGASPTLVLDTQYVNPSGTNPGCMFLFQGTTAPNITLTLKDITLSGNNTFTYDGTKTGTDRYIYTGRVVPDSVNAGASGGPLLDFESGCGSSLTMTGSGLINNNNTGTWDGGGLFFGDASGSVSLDSSTLTGNYSANEWGGGMDLKRGTCTFGQNVVIS